MFTPQKRYRRKVVTEINSPSMTEQQHLDTVSIHRIMERYRKAGVVDHVNRYQGEYMTFLGSTDLKENMDKMIEAQELFDSVPSGIRADFNNSPAEFIDFMQDPKNRKAIEQYGLDASHLPEIDCEPIPADQFTPPRGESVVIPPQESSDGSAEEPAQE